MFIIGLTTIVSMRGDVGEGECNERDYERGVPAESVEVMYLPYDYDMAMRCTKERSRHPHVRNNKSH